MCQWSGYVYFIFLNMTQHAAKLVRACTVCNGLYASFLMSCLVIWALLLTNLKGGGPHKTTVAALDKYNLEWASKYFFCLTINVYKQW